MNNIKGNSNLVKGNFFTELFNYFYKSPKNLSKKQWSIITIWIVVNFICMFLYMAAGASFGLALVNCIYGILIIFGYFTRVIAMLIAPIFILAGVSIEVFAIFRK